ncbi:MAG: ATP synthase F0 subunit B [Anaerolineae bacterium]|nr:ATP synthase F0 subunit B [Anaerolineae bacterium]
MDIIQLVDRLESLLNRSRRLPLTSGVVVNEEEFLEIIDQLRVAVPEEIKAARRMQQDRSRVLSEAQEEAQGLLEEARKQVAVLVDQDAVVRNARAHAERIIQQAEQQAQDMQHGADEYAVQVLRNLDQHLSNVHAEVRNGLVSIGGSPTDSDQV